MQKVSIFMMLISALFMGNMAVAQSKGKRGNTAAYDEGPVDSNLAKLFAQTPNYRAFGQEVIGGRGEKFRWKFGPMWYRGRLDGTAKVLIIGQEGAQDENVSNRSFTGSTGTKMQKFLNHLGINQSYLFLNTFVYTITGQYSLFGADREDKAKLTAQENLLWLAQNEDSVVVKHRHDLFDYVLDKNPITLVIGVGTAGKDSAATLANHITGNTHCSNSRVGGSSGCLVKRNGKNILFVGVPHPGGASPRNGGDSALTRLLSAFDGKAKQVLQAIKDRKINLATDPGARRASPSTKYRYGNASVPHADFAFGTNWRMGEWGTSSNRRGSHTIQVFSSNGCYNNGAKEANGRCSTTKVDNIKYNDPPSLINSAPSQMASCDVPYESSKACTQAYKEFDKGPGKTFSRLLVDWFEEVDWNKLGVNQHLSFGHTGIYRGRVESAKTLVITDQFAHDDMFSGRALTGEMGQKFQTKLDKEGRDYVIVRTLPVDTLDLSDRERSEIISNSKVKALRDKILEYVMYKSDVTKIVGVGVHASRVAKEFADQYDGVSVETVSETDVRNMKLSIIPRKDLPAHTRWWMGTSGDRAAKAYKNVSGERQYSGDYYKIYAPRWATKWRAGKISNSGPYNEAESVEKFKVWRRNN